MRTGIGKQCTIFTPACRPSMPWLSDAGIDRCIAPSMVISFMNRYNQKPFIGLIGAGQMNDVCAVPTAASETLEFLLMRSYHHNVGSHVKLPAGPARNPLPHKHVGKAKSL